MNSTAEPEVTHEGFKPKGTLWEAKDIMHVQKSLVVLESSPKSRKKCKLMLNFMRDQWRNQRWCWLLRKGAQAS